MKSVLGRYAGLFYSVLRIIAGLLFLCHGTQKVFGFPGDRDPLQLFASLPAWGGVIEVICGTLITIGLFTSTATFIASGEMAFAYFLRHSGTSTWPILNHGELAVLYCFLFLFFATSGSGMLSIDSILHRTKSSRVREENQKEAQV
jgi:putative oxidoreductase